MRVLVLEDDLDIQRALCDELVRSGFGVDPAATLVDAELLFGANEYDAFVLDRRVSDGDSLEQLEQWRRDGLTVPVLFLTAHDAVADRVAGFDAGGDDYLGKPFALAEVVARVRRLCRQRQQTVIGSVVSIADLVVDIARREVRRDGVRLALTAKELAVLELLVATPGIAVSKEHLMEHCWDERTDPRSNTVEVHIASLRRKLGEPSLIETRRGIGYLIGAPDSQDIA